MSSNVAVAINAKARQREGRRFGIKPGIRLRGWIFDLRRATSIQLNLRNGLLTMSTWVRTPLACFTSNQLWSFWRTLEIGTARRRPAYQVAAGVLHG